LVERDLLLLGTGRHFRLNKNAKLVIGRNAAENNTIESAADKDILLYVQDYPGPTAVLQFSAREPGSPTDSEVAQLAAAITVRYSDCPPDQTATVTVLTLDGEDLLEGIEALDGKKIESYRI